MYLDAIQLHSFGIGKMIVIYGKQLIKLGYVQMQMFDILAEATSFITACHGTPSLDNMTLRYQVRSNKLSNRHMNSAPELRSLLPTAETIQEHIHPSPNSYLEGFLGC